MLSWGTGMSLALLLPRGCWGHGGVSHQQQPRQINWIPVTANKEKPVTFTQQIN